MTRQFRRQALASAMGVAALVASSQTAQADDLGAPGSGPASDEAQLEELVVTAQKREQSMNDVPMSITAATGEQMAARGVSDPADLGKLVPGFTAQPAPTGIPVYTLRGVGYYDEALAASPAVSVYVDEAPLPFSIMANGAIFDLARVEVLKGPQGTLFGQNSTGGAINFVAAKPTPTPEAGLDASYGRFDTFDLQGYASGPLGDTVRARLALRAVRSGDWQQSYTRNDSLGAQDLTQGRLLVDWRPTEALTITLNLNGWIDKSDTLAPQVIAITPQNPAGMLPEVANFPLAPNDSRAADWTIGRAFKKDDSFYQVSARADYQLTQDIVLTSITAFQRMERDATVDGDGTPFENVDLRNYGFIRAFTQELRLTGETERLTWIVGANYEHDRTRDRRLFFVGDASNREIIPGIVHDGAELRTSQQVDTVAAFANLEYRMSEQVALLGGLRFTQQDRSATMCSADAGNNQIRLSFTVLQSLFKGGAAVPTILANGCLTFDANFNPGPVSDELKEDNISWRLGANWTPAPATLVYVNVSQGYKAGSFPTIFATSLAQDKPVTQESLLAYEVGAKLSLADRTLQLNSALFYYDYKDKQLLGKYLDPSFGVLQALVNIPKSELYGAEAQVLWRPVRGLDLSAAATYIHSNIKEYVGLTSTGVPEDLAGNPFPYSPKWQIVGDVQYNWDLSDGLSAFIGGGLTHNSRSTGGIGGGPILNIKAYTLIDLRAGLQSSDGAWRASIWGRNVTDEFYWTNAQRTQDTTLRLAGRPATYGATLSYRYR